MCTTMTRPGVVTGFVHAVDAKTGSVQVEYRHMEENFCSPWAPIAAPMSGGKRGQLFMPEVGDECLVAFQDGQFNHPYVLGFLWNGVDKSSETEAHQRVIVTPGGHQLRFEDKKDDTRIILKSNGKHSLTLEDKASEPLVRLKSNGGRELLLDDKTGAGKVEIVSGSHKVTMDDAPSATKIEINAGMGVVTLTLNTTPQPSLQISVAGNTIDITAAAMNVTAAGNISVTAGGTASISVGGTATISTGGAATISAGGAATISAAGAATISSATTTLTTGALTVSAGVSTFSGVVVASTFVTSALVSSVYTPSAGNFV